MPFLFIQLLALSSSSPLFSLSLFLSFRLSDPLSLPQFNSLSLSLSPSTIQFSTIHSLLTECAIYIA